ncbi:DNA polymerase III subunit alpha [Kineosporia sp. R_H_3]|uniref:DNA polymerase III subunit alpha n=1 Tax=Kineosporia sp. R_H_3 TaxID=1961848 RepID=UPI0018E91FC6|nr:DNA polymerase III subunit alpha [Kineosporia sp. R_H_3]
MGVPFTHLHVASGYSLRYGASTPAALVEEAAGHGMDALALTDRDGLYGAVKFTRACAAAGLSPILGVDLAVEPSGLLDGLPGWAVPAGRPAGRAPVRGGASVDPRHPRVTVLALAADAATGLPVAAGWGRLCRLVSATHLRGERGRPVATPDLVGEHAADPRSGAPALAVLLGPGSEVGRAVLARRPDLARAVLDRWRAVLPAPAELYVEVVCHHGAQGTPGSVGHAARMLAVAGEAGVTAVLTNAVRSATPDGATTVDVLDAARRLVALDTRHVDRVSAEGFLAPGGHMASVAREVARAAGDEDGATGLLAATGALADRCRLDAQADLGTGSVHLPEDEVLGLGIGESPQSRLRKECEAGIGRRYPGASAQRLRAVSERLEHELATITEMGFPAYFLTVGEVCGLIRGIGVRVAARGSGAGSLVNYLLGISGVDPLRHDLLMERFLSPMRAQLPDIDVDVESARRTEVYEEILRRFGSERVSCVSMMDTYRVRHAVRDVGAALGLPPPEVDAIAKSFPHIRARDVRHAIRELPELRASGLGAARLDLLFDLVERLDGLPRHVALHPCGVLLSDRSLLDRTPVESSWVGFPMSQFDKDDVEDLGLLKLDVLGIRMQSSMAYALQEVERVDGPDALAAGHHPQTAADPVTGYLDPGTGRIDLDAVPHDDEATFRLIRSTHTLGMFQIESPGQRELVGKFAPETFGDLIIDISLFRPGPVKSDMVTPFLRARQRWDEPDYLHPSLEPALAETAGVVVFHEQVLKIVAVTAGCSLAQADEVRRAMGSPAGQVDVEAWWRPRATALGYDAATVDRIWEVLKAFASFGFCKAHAAAFALPTYHSAWLKAHHPAAFLAGVLTHDPGMYPKRLILDDARNFGIAVLPLDVNVSDATYRVEKVTWWDEPPPRILDQVDARPSRGTSPDVAAADAGHDARPDGHPGGHLGHAPDDAPDAPDDPPTPRPLPGEGLPDGRPYGIRLALADVKGISEAEVARIVAGRPYHSLADFWHRAHVSRPVVERLVVAGAFDTLYGLGSTLPVRRRGRVTRRDLLLQVAELERWTRSVTKGRPGTGASRGAAREAHAAAAGPDGPHPDAVREATARQSQAPRAAAPPQDHSVQLALDLGDAPDETVRSGLPEMTGAERVRAELEVLGLDASRHVLDFYVPLLDALGVTRSADVLRRRSRSELLVAGVKVATQTPPVRSGRRVVFLTLDDATGPVDATFFEDAQGPYAATVFHSWLLVVRGVLRRTGPRGVSLRATGAWELPVLWDAWVGGGLEAVRRIVTAERSWDDETTQAAVRGAAASRSSRPVMVRPPVTEFGGGVVVPARDGGPTADEEYAAALTRTGLPSGDRDVARPAAASAAGANRAGGMGGGSGHRRVLVHASGFRQSPYADIKPPGENTRDTRRMLAAEGAGPVVDGDRGRRPLRPGEQPVGPEDRAAGAPTAADPTAAGGDPRDAGGERRRRSEPPRKLWHASPGSSGR